jgi:predicted nucleic acid-binding Zn ribbon protein
VVSKSNPGPGDAAAHDESEPLPSGPPLPSAEPIDRAANAARAATGADLARATLAAAREDARARAATTARSTRAADRKQRRAAEPVRDSGEPVAFGAAVSEMLDERGWQAEAASAQVLANWEAIAGAEVAAACRPVRLRHGELVLEAESTAWATQLRLLSRSILARIRAELGPDVVRKLVVRGPTTPDWRHGRLRVPGPGPRDTYG